MSNPAEPIGPPRTAVVAPDGTVGSVLDTDLDTAKAAGFRPLTADQQRYEAAKAAEEESPVGGVVAGIRGLGRGVTGGLYDAAVVGATELLQGEGAARDVALSLRASEDVYPTLSGGAEIAGMLVPTPVSRAAGMAGAAARTGVAARGLGRVAQTATEMAVQGAIEGATYAAGSQVSEDALGDHATTAEKLFAAAGKGALFGGLLGGGLGAGASAIGGVLARRGAAVAEREAASLAGREAAAVEAGAAEASVLAPSAVRAEAEAGASAGVSAVAAPAPVTAPEGAVESLAARYIRAQGDDEVRASMQHVFDARRQGLAIDDAMQATTRRLTAATDDMLASMQGVREGFHGASKAKKIVELVDTPHPERALGATFATVDRIRGEVERLAAHAQGEGRVALSRVQDGIAAIDKFNRRMVESIKIGTPTIDTARAAFTLLDRLKQDIGNYAGFGARSKNEVQQAFDAIYHEIRPVLEDTALWGRAGDAQRTINIGTTHMLERAADAERVLVDATEVVGGKRVLRGAPDKISAHLKGILDVESDLKKESIARFVAGHEEQLAAIRQHWPMSAVDEAMVAKGEQAVARFRKELATAEEQARVAAAAKKRLGEEATSMFSGLTGMAVDYFSSPVRTAARLADIQRSVDKMSTSIKQAVAGALDRIAKPVRAVVTPAQAEAVAREVRALAASPLALQERVRRAYGGVSDAAPRVGGHLAATASRAVAFLASKAPLDMTPRATLTPQFYQPTLNASEVRRFARYVQGTQDPLSVLRDMRRGEISREGVEALREVYPKIYAEVREEMLVHLASLRVPPPYQQRVQLAILMGIPSDPTLTPEFIAAMQATKAPASSPAQAGGVPGSSPGRRGRPIDTDPMMAPSERIEAGRR